MKVNKQADFLPSTYGDKVERIYRVLLSRKIKKMTWYRVAKEAGVGYSWAYRVLKDLENARIIKDLDIRDAKAAFRRWAGRDDRRVYREYNIQDPAKVLRKAKMDYAFTGYFAENMVGHYVFPRFFELYIHREDAAGWHKFLSESGYVGKGNVQVILSDEHVFFERGKVDGWPVVSIQQLIVDLYRTGAECAEAADLLVEKEFG